MTMLCLYDAVTLRHFGAIARLDVLEARCRYLDPPHWTQAVYDEINDAVNSPGCREILNAGWLSSPLVPQSEDQRKILLVTDDNGAYDFARRRLRPGRVFDTVDVLREAVTNGDINSGEALNLVNAIRNSGRSIRRVHPGTLLRDYFR